jgi:hypothetical protein
MNEEGARGHLGRVGWWVVVAVLSVGGAGARGDGLLVGSALGFAGCGLAAAAPPTLLSSDQVRAAVEIRLERMRERRDRRQRQRDVPGGPGVPEGATDPPVIRRDPPPLPPEVLDRVNR